ncbi:MAG TPA: DUF882 domain-containing protein [Rhizomicrobium sp.]|nr:DUF882 domain-containing protein [Rhizomicrobium sp.]
MKKVWHRRQVLGAAGAVACAGIASPAIANIGKANVRTLALNNLHTGERAKIDYWADSTYLPDALKEIDHLLRDYHNNEVHTIEPKLLDLVNLLHQRVGSAAEVQVISGYRSPATNAAMHEHSAGVAAHSLHMKGMAMDIRLGDVALDRLHAAAMAMRAGGVGYYPASDFVHVDVGRVRYWGA